MSIPIFSNFSYFPQIFCPIRGKKYQKIILKKNFNWKTLVQKIAFNNNNNENGGKNLENNNSKYYFFAVVVAHHVFLLFFIIIIVMKNDYGAKWKFYDYMWHMKKLLLQSNLLYLIEILCLFRIFCALLHLIFMESLFWVEQETINYKLKSDKEDHHLKVGI